MQLHILISTSNKKPRYWHVTQKRKDEEERKRLAEIEMNARE